MRLDVQGKGRRKKKMRGIGRERGRDLVRLNRANEDYRHVVNLVVS
jgi:hypothetical protein